MFGIGESNSHDYRQGRLSVQIDALHARQAQYVREALSKWRQPKVWTWQDEASRLQNLLLERDAYIAGLERHIADLKSRIGDCEEDMLWQKEEIKFIQETNDRQITRLKIHGLE